MNKYLKKLALVFPAVRKYHRYVEDLRKDNEKLRQYDAIVGELRLQVVSLNGQLGEKISLLNRFDELHSDIVDSAWNESSKRKQYVCTRPFTNMRIDTGGNVATCCLAWLKVSNKPYLIGNILTDSFDEVWNSDSIKRLRYSVTHGNFEYCSRDCPILQSPHMHRHIMLPRETSGYQYDKWQDCYQDKTPVEIDAMFDYSCNLHCFMCRNQVHIKTGAEKDEVAFILEKFVRPALKNCKKLAMDGNGEFLASDPYKQFLQTISKTEFPSLRLVLFTNGMLFTPERWGGHFPNLNGMSKTLYVSIDAASKSTYEKYRRGGKWEVLCENMEYISSLRASGEIGFLQLSFVVHSGNFKEMEDFVSLALSWNADKVFFQRLVYLGTFSSHENFVQYDVFSPGNPLRSEAVRIMKKIIHDTTTIKIDHTGCPVNE